MEPVAVALAVIVVVVMIILLGGVYLKNTQPPATPAPTPETIAVTTIPVAVPATSPETPPPTPEVTPSPEPTQRGTYAEAAMPVRDPDPYNAPDYTTNYNPKGYQYPIIFHQSYQFKYQYEAVVAHVHQSPLIIDFAVSPGSSTPIRSFFLITVRENATQKVIAQDGYFRTYSSNSPKRLIFSTPGTYHINMYGAFVSTDLTIRAPT